MAITGKIIIDVLIRFTPEAEDTLRWHGLNLSEQTLSMTLKELCEAADVELEELLEELETSLDLSELEEFEEKEMSSLNQNEDWVEDNTAKNDNNEDAWGGVISDEDDSELI